MKKVGNLINFKSLSFIEEENLRRLYLALLLIACLIVGVVIGGTMVSTIQFTYKIVGEGVTMTPNEVIIYLGELKPGSSGDGAQAKGFATIYTSGAEITHGLSAENSSAFDAFNVKIIYYQVDMKAGTIDLSLTHPEASLTLPKGIYELYMEYSWHVKVDAPVGTKGTVYLGLAYSD